MKHARPSSGSTRSSTPASWRKLETSSPKTWENTDPTGTIRGCDALYQYVSVFKNAIPDATLNPKTFVESGNTVVTEGTFTGTFTKPLASPQGELPPRGKSFELPFMEINDVENGR